MKAPAIFIAAALGTALLSTPALAESAAQPLSIKVSDLDLDTEAGQAQLARRIDSAARQACGLGEVSTGTILQSRESRTCFNRVKTAAQRRIAERGTASAPNG